MAYEVQRINKAIRGIIEAAAPDETLNQQAIIRRLVDTGVVRSDGTAHRYVKAYYTSEALKVETHARAPEFAASDLPERVLTAYSTLLEAAGSLKNEVGAALDDLSQRSVTSFGKMITDHMAAQHAELDELAEELRRVRKAEELTSTNLAAATERVGSLSTALTEREASLSDALASVAELRIGLAAQEAKAAALVEAIDGKDKVIAALESERLIRDRRDEQADQQISSLREQVRQLSKKLEESRLLEEPAGRAALARRDSGGKAGVADSL